LIPVGANWIRKSFCRHRTDARSIVTSGARPMLLPVTPVLAPSGRQGVDQGVRSASAR
jgi:hypothetical protein